MKYEFTVYDKRNGVILILVASVLLAGVTQLFWLVFIGFILALWVSATIKCPKCQGSLSYHPKGYATPIIPDECWRCHYKLKKK